MAEDKHIVLQLIDKINMNRDGVKDSKKRSSIESEKTTNFSPVTKKRKEIEEEKGKTTESSFDLWNEFCKLCDRIASESKHTEKSSIIHKYITKGCN